MPYIIGAASSKFGKHPQTSFRDLAREVVLEALKDAQHTAKPEAIYFGNCAMHAFGQANIRGQTLLSRSVAALEGRRVEIQCRRGREHAG